MQYQMHYDLLKFGKARGIITYSVILSWNSAWWQRLISASAICVLKEKRDFDAAIFPK